MKETIYLKKSTRGDKKFMVIVNDKKVTLGLEMTLASFIDFIHGFDKPRWIFFCSLRVSIGLEKSLTIINTWGFSDTCSCCPCLLLNSSS
jgi:hypothetical protein